MVARLVAAQSAKQPPAPVKQPPAPVKQPAPKLVAEPHEDLIKRQMAEDIYRRKLARMMRNTSLHAAKAAISQQQPQRRRRKDPWT